MPRSIRPSITRRSVLAGSLVSAVALALTACGSKGSADGSNKYDPDGAKKILADAGYKDTDKDGIMEKNGKPVKLKVVVGI